jgi:hypothetical protein
LTWANLKAAIASFYNSTTASMTNKTLVSPTISDPMFQVGGANVSYVQGASAGMILWKGTKAQYDAITTKDPNTIYAVTA